MPGRLRRLRRLLVLGVVVVVAVLALRHLGEEAALPFRSPAIGVVEIRGVISESEDTVATLKRFGETDGIGAVVVRVESPGGAVGPSQEIHDAVTRLRQKKPVVASLGSLAASGGYYVAAACKPIVANPGTLTGSIGVVMAVRNLEGLADWAGVKETVIKSAPYKDIANPLRTLTAEERVLLQRMVDDVHGQFVQAVAQGRAMSEEAVRQVADGRLYSGAQARELGLVDTLGGLEDAVALAAEAAGLEGEPRTVRAGARRRLPWVEWLDGLFGWSSDELRLARLPEGPLFLYLGREPEMR
jgi:protease-4